LTFIAGYASARVSETITSGFTVMKEKIKFSGSVFGVKIGAIYDLTENGELGYGFKIDEYSYSDLTSNNGHISAKWEQTDIGLFLGINYKF
jgi:opacity protein-like surface antigen